MTTLLSKAFERASALSTALQDELARELMDEIEWELQWDKSLASSVDKIDSLADEALREHRAGSTREMGMDDL